jgi:hypothetical protein
MAPSTRSTRRETTPDQRSRGPEADTIKKTRFYNAYDSRYKDETLTAIAADCGTTQPTASRWLHQRSILGSPAYRHTRKISKRLRRRSKVTDEMYKMLVSPPRNPVRDQAYEAQIEYHGIHIQKRQLQRRLKQCTNGGQRYKQAYICKRMSKKNLASRLQYGQDHQDKTIEDFWQWVTFTDEAHIDPTSECQGQILRERGKRYNTENIQERRPKEGVRLHVAGWINWHSKCDKLEFYNDEDDYMEKPTKPRKPKKSKWESEDEFESRILEWKASIGHDKEVRPKGNSMTQKYYTERLLPLYITAINKDRWDMPCFNDIRLLQEDNDPSHGTRKQGLAQRLKQDHGIKNLFHPAQSPDLNPMEACWNILKQRARRRLWHTIEELKEILQDEWSKIAMQEVHTRITTMPERCKLLVETGGKPIKTALW